MDVRQLLLNLKIENEQSCNDTFQFFMAGVIESIYITTRRVNEDLLKSPSDPAPIIINLIKNRNFVVEGLVGAEGEKLAGIKLRQFNPIDAYQEYGMRVYSDHLRNDEYISGHTLLAYLCARLALRHHSRGSAVRAAIYAQDALHCVAFMCSRFPNEFEDKAARSSLARHAAMTRIANDPRQKAKQYVFNCWQVWQEEPARYTTKADFSKNMLNQEQCRSLSSQKKIEDWCREWEKSHPAG